MVLASCDSVALACAVILLAAVMVHQYQHTPADLGSHSTSADVRPETQPEVVAQKHAPCASAVDFGRLSETPA